MQKGLALGYRRVRNGGTWPARIRLPDTSKYLKVKIGSADDLGTAEAATALSFDLATTAAREAYVQAEERRVSGPLPTAGKAIIEDVLVLYREAYAAGETGRRKEPGRDLVNLDSIFKCHLKPRLGGVRLDQLIEKNSRPSSRIWSTRHDEFDESEALRKRKARVNRVVTVLRAALNYGLKEKWLTKASQRSDRKTIEILASR